jgi:hypothetical protein
MPCKSCISLRKVVDLNTIYCCDTLCPESVLDRSTIYYCATLCEELKRNGSNTALKHCYEVVVDPDFCCCHYKNMKDCKLYHISSDFSYTPGPAKISEGEYSGELFRTRHLLPLLYEAIDNNHRVLLDFDGVAGYSPAWFEEVFSKLVSDSISYDQIVAYLTLKSDENPEYIEWIFSYLRESE